MKKTTWRQRAQEAASTNVSWLDRPARTAVFEAAILREREVVSRPLRERNEALLAEFAARSGAVVVEEKEQVVVICRGVNRCGAPRPNIDAIMRAVKVFTGCSWTAGEKVATMIVDIYPVVMVGTDPQKFIEAMQNENMTVEILR